ncbi:MAG: hypothetical protein AAGA18_13845 [Verrucomicrobiota bacterium]
MFLDSSRYAKVDIVQTTNKVDQSVSAIKLRKLPKPSSQPVAFTQEERLDTLAQKHFNDSSKFWHIADANSELVANKLVEDSNNSIKIPKH